MNRLSERLASGCENSKGSVCQCRCGGAFHGATRGSVLKLPPDDPHYAVMSAADQQLSIFEALELAPTLERLELPDGVELPEAQW